MSSGVAMAVLDGGTPYDLFDVVELSDGLARVRTPFLFEIGEEMKVRVQANGRTFDAKAKVRAHVDGVTELELVK